MKYIWIALTLLVASYATVVAYNANFIYESIRQKYGIQ